MTRPVKVLGGTMWRNDPPVYTPGVVEREPEPCHELPDIGNGPEIFDYNDIVVCEVCRGAWRVGLGLDEYNFMRSMWFPVTFWRSPLLWYDAKMMLAKIEDGHNA